MLDAATIGGLASSILGMAAEAALKGAVGEATKGAYKALKAKVGQWAASDVDALEHNPTSPARRAVVAEVVDALPETDKVSIKALTSALAEALRSNADNAPIGIDIGVLEAASVQLAQITVTDGIGFRAEQVHTTGNFGIEKLNVGGSPGKDRQQQ